MMYILEDGDRPHLPHGLSIMDTYTEMTTRSKQVVVVVNNLITALVTITRGVKIAQVVTVNAIPQVEASPGVLVKLNEMHGIQRS